MRLYPATLTAALAAVLMGAMGAWAMEGEVIQNGSFEAKGGGGSPWQGWRTGLWDGGEYSFESAPGHGSATAALIRCKKQGRGGIGQAAEAALEPGARYFLSVWVKAERADGGIIFVNLYSSQGEWGQVHLPGGTHDWVQIAKVLTAPAHGKLQLYIHNKTTGDVYLDDVSLRKLAPGEEPPAVGRRIVNDYRDLPPGKDYALGVSSTMEKVFRDETYPGKPAREAKVSLARGEGEGFQLVVIHPRKKLTGVKVAVSALALSGGGTAREPLKVTVSPVNYVMVRPNTRFYLDRPGWYPEVLLPDAPVDIEQNLSQPFWIDIVAPEGAAPGTYRGAVTVAPSNAQAEKLDLSVTVRSFAIPMKPSIRTITWVPMEGPKKLGGQQADYHDMALDHRLGPGGTVGSGFYWGVNNYFRNWGPQGGFTFDKVSEVYPTMERCLARGMNTFAMAVLPNLHREGKQRYDDAQLAQLGPFVKAYREWLSKKGWADAGLVYGYDECPKEHWGEQIRGYEALKKVCPEAKMIICLNEPEGVKAIAGHTDIWLMYIPFHEKSRIEELKKPNEEMWWSYGCMYPADRPNQFIPYPGIDLRITPWLAWKHNVTGLSNWGLTYWHESNAAAGRTFPTEEWVERTEVPGDGALIYPGPGGKPLASARLKNTRDGLEDYEYIVLAGKLAAKGDAKAKAALDEARAIITSPTVYTQDPGKLLGIREHLAEAIEAGAK